MRQDRTDAGHFVGRYAHADAGAADRDGPGRSCHLEPRSPPALTRWQRIRAHVGAANLRHLMRQFQVIGQNLTRNVACNSQSHFVALGFPGRVRFGCGPRAVPETGRATGTFQMSDMS